ncbi:DNA alkylation repair protein [Antribacter gilvus]|uniref:DNA alkylation repair protein n=1 Tax=Antribacter gilvus TaxID=2304675 RepID=UPI000F798BA8|nr:DNA alkylation repair protein [Antribacter gilvus]
MTTASTAEEILERLRELADPAEHTKISKRVDPGQVIGVRMKHLFDLAKAEKAMDLDEVRTLLRSPWYEARVVAVSILDFRAREGPSDSDDRRAVYELYLAEHDHIDAWDLVDRAAPRVIGDYLLRRSRDPLFELARSANPWERRTAVTAAFWLIRADDLADPLAIIDLLLDDEEHFVQTSVGTALREVGRSDAAVLEDFVTRNGHRISPVTRRLMTDRSPSGR